MRILVIRLDGLGDTVLTTPLLRALRDRWADSHISFVASPTGHACLIGHPAVDELIAFSTQDSTLQEKLALGRRLRAARFDLALSVTEKAWGYVWLRMSGAARRVAFWADDKPVKSLLFARTVTHRVPEFPLLHESERHLKLLGAVDRGATAGPLWLARQSGPGDGPLALHLSAKWLDGGWAEDWLIALIQKLALASAHGLLITAGGLEGQWARDVCTRLHSNGALVETLIGASFDAWTEALARCRMLISMDTGAVHVAAAVGLPVVDVFPAMDAERCVPRWKPWMVPHVIVLRGPPTPLESARVEQEILRASRSLMESAKTS